MASSSWTLTPGKRRSYASSPRPNIDTEQEGVGWLGGASGAPGADGECTEDRHPPPSDYDATVMKADCAVSPAAEALVMGYHDDGASVFEEFFE